MLPSGKLPDYLTDYANIWLWTYAATGCIGANRPLHGITYRTDAISRFGQCGEC